MTAELSARERVRLVAESAKRIRKWVSSGDESFAIELTRIASEIEYNALELEREFDGLGLANLSPGK
jgi:hypothetical protein